MSFTSGARIDPRARTRRERSEIVLGQQAFDVDGRHGGGAGDYDVVYDAEFHSPGALDKPHTGEIAIWRSRRSSIDWGRGRGIGRGATWI